MKREGGNSRTGTQEEVMRNGLTGRANEKDRVRATGVAVRRSLANLNRDDVSWKRETDVASRLRIRTCSSFSQERPKCNP